MRNMVMEKDILKKFPDYGCLSYLRWLFLIESDQYKKFYRNNQINKLIEEEKGLIKERDDILRQMEEKGEELYYKHNKAWEEAFNDDIGEKDFDDRVEEIIEEKSEELREDLCSVEEKLGIFRKKTKIVFNEARKRFKLKLNGNDLEHLQPIDGEMETHLRPKFLGHKEIPLFGYDPKQIPKIDFFKNAAVHQITSLLKDEEFLVKINPSIGEAIFTFDMRYPASFLVDVFKEKIQKLKGAQTVNIRPERRMRKKEWVECLLAYRLYKKQKNKKKNYLEIARLLGAHVKATKKGHEQDKVSYALSEIEKNMWEKKYNKRLKRDNAETDIGLEKTQIRENIKKKIARARELINMAGEGKFPCFDNQKS